MFKQLNNINSAFQYVRGFSLLFLVACVVVSTYALYASYTAINQLHNKIYILSNGKVMEAYAAERKDNIGVEARDHVKTFHHYFFTLDPDDQVIQANLSKALYLADGSAKRQYDNLKENGYYTNLISGNVSQSIEADSVVISTHSYPISFRYYGRQILTRPSTITTRSLITEGYLRSVARSDNNPHGFLIERWQILQNKDLTTQKR
jgi:conjugative transposon TraK protein